MVTHGSNVKGSLASCILHPKIGPCQDELLHHLLLSVQCGNCEGGISIDVYTVYVAAFSKEKCSNKYITIMAGMTKKLFLLLSG